MKNNVSVIIPTYNRADLVTRAVKSVLTAITPEDEIIVIDDGSTDNTADVLSTFKDKVRYYYIENSGLNKARDAGIALSRCPLVAFLDSDDEWLSDKIYLQRKVMDAFPDCLFCYSNLRSHLPNGEVVHNVLNIWRYDQWVGYEKTEKSLTQILGHGIPFSSVAELPEGRDDFNIHVGNIYHTLMEVYYVWACTLMVRKDAAGEALRFSRDRHQICEDWEAFARLAQAGNGAYLDCETAIQNVHTGARLTDVDSITQVSERIKLLHRVWGNDKSFMKSHSKRFYDVLNAQHLRRARYLIRGGRMKEARADLRTAGGGPLTLKFMASLPGFLTKALFQIRRRIRELRG